MEDEPSPSPRSKARYTGQVRLCTARYSYNPYDGPNENPEAELPLVAGKYLYVYGNMDDDGFYEGELLDGQRGLVPSNFVEFVQDKEKTNIPSEEGREEIGQQDHHPPSVRTAMDIGTSQDGLLGSSALVPCSNGTPLDTEDLDEDVVPYPRKISLIKQLARSVIVAWEPPLVPLRCGNISGYNVLVDGELRAHIGYGGRTKCLLEKLDLDGCVHRVSVQSVTDRGLSDELRCTVLVGANVVVAPCGLRVDDIQRDTAELSWLPSNSNYAHTIFLDGLEYAIVKPGRYRLRFVNLKPLTVYKVTVGAQPHQVPWQLPLEQRERKEAGVEFCTQAAGPPLPPQDVHVLCGPSPGVLQVHWKPPILSPTGMSNGVNVVGYAVCTKGQRVAEVLHPMANFVSVDLTRIQCLEAQEVIVRTLSVQGESQDSPAAAIPNNLLVPVPVLPLPAAPPPHLHSQPHPPHITSQFPGSHQAHGQTHPSHPPPPQAHPALPAQPQHRPPYLQQLHPCSQLPVLLHPPQQPVPQRPVCARDLDAKEHPPHQRGPATPSQPSYTPTCTPSSQHLMAMQSRSLEPPPPTNLRSPSPQRILPQPRGTLISDTVAKAIAREAAQRVAAETNGKGNRIRDPYRDKGQSFRHSDDEEDDEEGFGRSRRRGPSVDEFLRSSELGRPIKAPAGGRERRTHRGGSQPRKQPLMVPSIDGHQDHHSPTYYDDSESEESYRIFVALFDYDPLSMSPNPDAADEELPFKEGQIIKVFGDKDTDGFYRGELRGRTGLIPCNMVSEIRAEDEETLQQLIKQGFLPLSTPVDRIEQNRRGVRRDQTSRRMVALYDYDPRESSPNVDVEAELTFCAGDIIAVFGEIDEDGFYYGEMNGHRGLVPSNFLEEVPDDVEVYLTDTPSHPPQEEHSDRSPTNSATAAVSEGKRCNSPPTFLTCERGIGTFLRVRERTKQSLTWTEDRLWPGQARHLHQII